MQDRCLSVRFWFASAFLTTTLLCSGAICAEERPQGMAAIALLDNDSGSTLKGDIAEFVGVIVTEYLLEKAGYDQIMILADSSATKDGFFKAVLEALDEGFIVDIFIEAHGLPGRILVHDGIIWEEDIRQRLSGKGERLRLVYMMSCFSNSLVDVWLEVGADIACGHKGVNYIPAQHFVLFICSWGMGFDAETASWIAFYIGLPITMTRTYRRITEIYYGGVPSMKEIIDGSLPVIKGSTTTIESGLQDGCKGAGRYQEVL